MLPRLKGVVPPVGCRDIFRKSHCREDEVAASVPVECVLDEFAWRFDVLQDLVCEQHVGPESCLGFDVLGEDVLTKLVGCMAVESLVAQQTAKPAVPAGDVQKPPGGEAQDFEQGLKRRRIGDVPLHQTRVCLGDGARIGFLQSCGGSGTDQSA